MKSSAQRALAVPEILEHILFSLDEKNLLQVTSVSKTFLATINGSQKIKQKLWLEPCNKVFTYPFNGYYVPEVHFNHLLHDQHDVAVDIPVRPTMLLVREKGQVKIKYSARLGFETVAQNASCRDMVLFQPPVKVIQVHTGYQPRADTAEDERLGRRINSKWYMAHEMLQNEDGVRFGQVLNMIESLDLDGKVTISGEYAIQWNDDEDDAEGVVTEDNWSYTEERLVPKKKLIEVSVDDAKLAKINATIDVTHRKGLVPESFTPPTSVIQGIFGGS